MQGELKASTRFLAFLAALQNGEETRHEQCIDVFRCILLRDTQNKTENKQKQNLENGLFGVKQRPQNEGPRNDTQLSYTFHEPPF